MSKDHSGNSGKPTGRPRKGEGPRLPYEEIDRSLVFGDVVLCDDRKNTTVVYPSYRDLGRRYGVSHSLIAEYAKKHDCQRRREVAQARIIEKTDQKLVELRATALALSKDDELRIIDSYLAGFEKALAEGRVRFDNPGDFNTMVRLKEFIQGGADSRQEIHAVLSLEELQARHRRMMKTLDASDPGELEKPTAVGSLPPSGHQQDADSPPQPSFEADFEEVNGRFSGASGHFDEPREPARVAPRRPKGSDGEHEPHAHERGAHGAHVAPLRAVPPVRDAGELDDEAEG